MMTPVNMYCTKNMLFDHRTENCQAAAIISCYAAAATDVGSAAPTASNNTTDQAEEDLRIFKITILMCVCVCAFLWGENAHRTELH